MQFTKSAILFAEAEQKIPGGVNSPVRAFRSVGMHPLFIAKAQGAHLWDVDGNEFIDYVGSWGPMILGHAAPSVLGALQVAMEHGVSYGAPCEWEVRLAELVLRFYPGMEMVRMVNSGTEAVMGAVRLARGYTAKSKIIKFAGCYHGHADYLLVKAGSGAATFGVPDSEGVPPAFTQETLVADYNDLDQVIAFADEYPDQIAAIIIEPIAGNMGMVMPHQSFLRSLRELCDRSNILLIFDEVMTGFRVAGGGAVELYSVDPDIVVLGKIIGGGLPVGAYLSSRKIMQKLSPLGKVYQAGTLSGNPLAMAAGFATLNQLGDPDFYSNLQEKGSELIQSFAESAKRYGVAFCGQAVGGMFGFFFLKGPVTNFKDASQLDTGFFAQFFRAMLKRGIYLPPSAYEALFLSSAHGPLDITKTVQAFEESLAEVCGSKQ